MTKHPFKYTPLAWNDKPNVPKNLSRSGRPANTSTQGLLFGAERPYLQRRPIDFFHVRWRTFGVMFILTARMVLAQVPPDSFTTPLSSLATREAAQAAALLGLNTQIQKLKNVQSRPAEAIDARVEEFALRLELLDSIQHVSLEVDCVLAELSRERNQLDDLMTFLQDRRDRTVGRLNAAALIVGSGITAAAGATQFPSFSNRTQTVGNIVSIAAGSTAIVLSILGLRRQNGPDTSVGKVPNTLAPPLGEVPALNIDYPPAVMRFLNTIPVATPDQGTRLDQLKANWAATGRLSPAIPRNADKRVHPLTISGDPNVRVTIDEIRIRKTMLADVMGYVSLMKRDLGSLMPSLATQNAPR